MLEVLILGAIAAFLISRLFQVLGQRSGYENPELAAALSQKLSDSEGLEPEDSFQEIPDKVLDSTLEASVQKLKSLDSTFRTDWFLEGATRAFELLIEAFSYGDRETLHSLMSKEVYESFEQAIDAREAKHQHLETTLVKLEPVDIIGIKIHSSEAYITVRYTSEQINILYAQDGSILEGNAKQIEEVTDEWTFKRHFGSDNPNWCLVDIKS